MNSLRKSILIRYFDIIVNVFIPFKLIVSASSAELSKWFHVVKFILLFLNEYT